MADAAVRPVNWYCDIASGHPLHGPYHDTEYGFPVDDDRVLFERLCLEVFQAGLSWELVLKKRVGLNRAFDGFDPAVVAGYGPEAIERLRTEPDIIRNRRKIAAVIHNAAQVVAIQRDSGSFADWIAASHPLDLGGWVKAFKARFKFMGPEVINEFLMSIGYLPGAHRPGCPVHARILALRPAWRDVSPA